MSFSDLSFGATRIWRRVLVAPKDKSEKKDITGSPSTAKDKPTEGNMRNFIKVRQRAL